MENKQEDINQNTVIILLLSILFFIILLIISTVNLYNTNFNYNAKKLNDIIESENKKEGKKAYLEIKSISQIFARNKGTKNGYYFASDGEYNYVVYLDDTKANELFKKDLENNSVKLYGITKKVNDDIKKIAIDNYNFGNEENEQISIKDYYSYFGDVYLDNVNVK